MTRPERVEWNPEADRWVPGEVLADCPGTDDMIVLLDGDRVPLRVSRRNLREVA